MQFKSQPETRTVTQTKYYLLYMHEPNGFGFPSLVAAHINKKELVAWVDGQKLQERENDNGWIYTFKEGLLREYNSFDNTNLNIHEKWLTIEEADQKFKSKEIMITKLK